MYSNHLYKILGTRCSENLPGRPAAFFFSFWKYKILFLLLVLFFPSCKKDTERMDIVPAIELIRITPAVANEYSDPVIITIHFTDGDGDLGENSASVKNCFVTDNRIGITSSYRIQQLSPDGTSIPIKGNLDIELGGQGITDGSAQQDVSFSLYVVDRAGHQSNILTTGSVSIRRP